MKFLRSSTAVPGMLKMDNACIMSEILKAKEDMKDKSTEKPIPLEKNYYLAFIERWSIGAWNRWAKNFGVTIGFNTCTLDILNAALISNTLPSFLSTRRRLLLRLCLGWFLRLVCFCCSSGRICHCRVCGVYGLGVDF